MNLKWYPTPLRECDPNTGHVRDISDAPPAYFAYADDAKLLLRIETDYLLRVLRLLREGR